MEIAKEIKNTKIPKTENAHQAMEGNGLGDTELNSIETSDIGCHQQRLQNSLVTCEDCVLGQWKQYGGTQRHRAGRKEA